MKRGTYVTLFVPESLDVSGSLWRRYVVSSVFLDLEENGGAASGTAYVFERRSAAYFGSARCVMPCISSGCALLPFADLSDDTRLCLLPDGCFKVTDVKRYQSPLSAYVRLSLG
jgi:hypothetical protein